MPDPFGRALWDHYRGERAGPLRQRDGEEALEHPIEEFYFESDDEPPRFLDRWLDGPLLDVGAGAGRDALTFQNQRNLDVVAVDVSPHLVDLLADRGVRDARQVDMFALREAFAADRFRSVLIRGTQVGLVKSLAGLQRFLADLDHVTAADATVVFDAYDPDYEGASDMLGFRADASAGLAYRVLAYEYDGDLGEALLFRLFGPDRVREVVADSAWQVRAVDRPHDSYHYQVALSKAGAEPDDPSG